ADARREVVPVHQLQDRGRHPRARARDLLRPAVRLQARAAARLMDGSVPAPHRSPPPEIPGRTAPAPAGLHDEPAQMGSGTIGKSGFLRLGFERRDGTTILAELDRRVPYLAQRALHPDAALPDLAHVFLITSSGCLLQGDRLALEVA